MPTRRRPPRSLLALLLALALLAPALASTPAVRADTCVVTSGQDSGPGTLRAALGNTDGYANCTTITFQSGLTVVSATSMLIVDRPVTIQGPGAVALAVRHSGPASATGAVFFITGGPATIGGLTVRGGRTTGGNWGAGLTIVGSLAAVTVSLDEVVVTDNVAADWGGGGLYVSNAAVTITDSTISGNTAGAAGAGPDRGGGGLLVDDAFGDARVTLTGSTVSGNQAINNTGGGIQVYQHTAGKSASVTLTGSTVSGNTAGLSGGGIANSQGTALLTGSTLSANATSSSGGGLYNAGGVATLTNTTVSGNNARINGGGLAADGGTATLKFATVTGNTADSDDNSFGIGGGIIRFQGPATILSSIVAGNRHGPNAADDCAGVITTQGHNLWGDNAACPVSAALGDQDLGTLEVTMGQVLDPLLADHGGPTRTHSLVAGSPALDRGDDIACATAPVAGLDQRGVSRPQGERCDIGAFEAELARLTVAVQGPGKLSAISGSFPLGTVVTLVPTPDTGAIFVGWTVDSTFQGWARPLTITVDADHSVVASFVKPPAFGDVPGNRPDSAAIAELAARGAILGYEDGGYGPDDTTLRAQMAALIARGMGYSDNPPNPFSDRCDPTRPANCVDTELWRRVAELASRNVARGYTDAATCAPSAAPCYAPRDDVLHAQVLSFIARAMVDKGYWTQQPIDPNLFGGVLNGTGHEQDVATYAHYTQGFGGVPDFPVGGGFSAWDEAATRGWFARALWTALNSHWSVDRVP